MTFVSFLFMLLHCLLPTQDRVSRLGGSENGGLCKLCNTEIEDTLHAFFTCPHNMVLGNALLGYVQVAAPGLTQEGALKLLFETDMAEDETLASLYVLSAGLRFIWEKRTLKKQVALHEMRAEVEAKISILRKSRHRNVAEIMEIMLQ